MSYAEGYDPSGGVAIVGMAGRFPGAKNIDEFWRNLKAGVESISFFTEEELESSPTETPALRNDPSYVRARGVLEGGETFDAAFFGMNPREAELTDPQQRVFLEAAWEALENAGYVPQAYPGAIGVFAGMTNNTYFPAVVYSRRDAADVASSLQTMMGNEKDYLATRVSYKLNLRGPSLNIQTACSTSLVAVCQAFQSLLGYQCDMALAGGVSVVCPQRRGYLHYEGAVVSPDGHCRTFDAQARGTVFSNGVGIVVLRRLSDALADGDHIYAVIKGAALNNDGSARVSFAAPSVDGQAEVIAMAQALAGIDPETISYVEAHGTATALGDPIEIAGLTQAFRLGTGKAGFCAIGSVKANIGHLDAASGVAGLMKTVLALTHKILPPSLHFRSPNPKIDFVNSPFYVNTSLSEWNAGPTPRRAGVSSFGSGGTNAHVVLEEAPPREPAARARTEQLLVLSAKTASALEQATTNLVQHLEEHPGLDLADVAYTLQAGRQGFSHRRMAVCGEVADAVRAFQSLDPKRVVTKHHEQSEAAVIFTFPGQGAQYVNMGLHLYQEEPLFRTQVNECAEVLAPHLNLDIRTVLYPDPGHTDAAKQQITQTFITQPALFVIEYALAQLWLQWGIKPKAMIGHSLGEYAAACLSGVFSRDEALMVLAHRARLMQALPPGAMLAVRLPEVEVTPRLDKELSVAALNGPSLTVVSGPVELIQTLQEGLAASQVACRRLPTSHAFHSRMLDPILPSFADLMGRVRLNPPQIPWVSCLTGEWITAAQATDPGYWAQQLRHPVRFTDGVRTLAQNSHQVFLEVGPGHTLSTLVKQIPDRPAGQEILSSLHPDQNPTLDSQSMLQALGKLWLAGATVDWTGVHTHQQRRRVPLPTYPFERKRFWVTPPHTKEQGEGRQQNIAPDVGRSPAPVTQGAPVTLRTTPEEMTMDEPRNGVAPTSSREAGVLSQLRTLFSDVSGISASEIDGSAPFLEIGLDSLLLTQVSVAIHKAFGVKVTFRQLLEDLSTLESLATHLAPLLPPEKRVAETPVQLPHPSETGVDAPLPVPQSESRVVENGRHSEPPALGGAGKIEPGALERVLAKQLELMSRQLDMLRSGQAAPVSPVDRIAASAAAPVGAPVPPPPSSLNGAHAASASGATTVPKGKPDTRAFGPYKPIDKGTGGGLTPHQQQYLDALIARYTARTPESKRLTARHRPHLADPRSAAGFRLLWKEIVYPIVTVRSAGSRLWDVDGNEYIDVTNGFGAIMFGHSPAFVTAAVEAQLKQGMEIGPQSPLAGQVAELLCQMTGMERATFCNTGSEAVLAALRMARTVTGRDKIVMFSGDYHGIFDEVLVRSTLVNGVPKSRPVAPGIPAGMVENVLVLDYGSPEALEVIRAHAHELAAVVVEPVQSRRLELQPREFLKDLREVTTRSGTVLIFDEVVTGFRVHPGGAQAVFDVRADLATYGKVIGGGLPIGVVAGRAAFMDTLDGGVWNYGDASAPEVGVTFFAGTFVRHPLALAAAWACLNHLKEHSPELQRQLNLRTTQLAEALTAHADRVGAPIRITHFSSFFSINFPPDLPYAGLFFAYMREKGIHVWEGRAGVLTTAHTDQDLDRIVEAFKASLAEMQAGGFLPGVSHEQPPLPGARLGKDQAGNPAWFVPDPDRPGKYLQIGEVR